MRRQPEAAGRRERAVVRAVMLMMWPLAAAASSLRALSASVPFYAYPPLARASDFQRTRPLLFVSLLGFVARAGTICWDTRGTYLLVLCCTVHHGPVPSRCSRSRYIVGKSRHRARTESQREESGESQFLGSLWRATLSRGMDANLGSLDRVYEARDFFNVEAGKRAPSGQLHDGPWRRRDG